MPNTSPVNTENFKQYRRELGFSSQAQVKEFFGAKDITPAVDPEYLKELNQRLNEMVKRVNSVVNKEIKLSDPKTFKQKYINHPFRVIKQNNILPALNNQGRRPERVYFSWMRGYVVSSFFLKALSIIFEINAKQIKLIGDDDLKSVETFKRTPKADLEIPFKDQGKMRVEIQSGFTGTNDLKQHKVLEARKVAREQGLPSLAIHFDLYNGQAAFIRLDRIKDRDMNWITRINRNSGLVWNIDQNFFFWNFMYYPPSFKHISANYYT